MSLDENGGYCPQDSRLIFAAVRGHFHGSVKEWLRCFPKDTRVIKDSQIYEKLRIYSDAVRDLKTT